MARKLILLSLAALVAAVVLAPSSASAASAGFRNHSEITIPQQGTASAYPSSISVRTVRGPVTDIKVSLNDVTHTRPRDLDVLLVAPDGSSVVLMSDACGDGDVSSRTWTFHSNGGLPDMGDAECPNPDYADSNWGAGDTWPGAAPSVPGELSQWHRKVMHGSWKLYVHDDEAGDSGKIADGWGMSITTAPVDVVIPGEGASGPASPYPVTQFVKGTGDEIVQDVDVDLGPLVHDRHNDLDLLLVGPDGQAAMLMSDACGNDPVEGGFAFDDEAPFKLLEGLGQLCGGGIFQPTDYDVGDAFPAPAPAGPYATSLSAFDFTNPNGEWRLYAVDDDESAKDGYLLERFRLNIATRLRATVGFAEATAAVTEGTKRALTITRSATGALGPAAVTVTTVPGTAGAGADFTPIARTVEFAAGQATQTVELDAPHDSLAEPTETFAVELSNPTGDALLGTPGRADVTISDAVTPTAVAAKRCATKRATIVGTKGRDVLRGTRGADVIAALAGNDRIEGLRGNDLICGGRGRDRLVGGAGRDRLLGGPGRDICLGGPGRDRVQCP
ncbi:MAG TPA: proprotein convertase P-domain-containing protein [Thermoleophilaceae bacterium]|nr:proprotein convertase P-domain-containing protein [Thermoleophilaceae bacterium]